MATNVLMDTSDKDIGGYRITNTASPPRFTERRKTAPKPPTRTKRIKKHQYETVSPQQAATSWNDGDPQRKLSLPKLLNVPVRSVNECGLTEVQPPVPAPRLSKSTPEPERLARECNKSLASGRHTESQVIDEHPGSPNVVVYEPESPRLSGAEGPEDIANDQLVDKNQNMETQPTMDNEQVSKAKHKRRFVLEELVQTEKKYVEDISVLVHGYMPEMSQMDLPEGLREREKIVFGNIKAILAFHRDKFLPGILAAKDNPQELGALFTKYEKQLRLYVTYCENKPRSEYLVAEYLSVFQKLASRLKQKLQIADMLIKPVQRIMKYQLLLKDILKHTEKCQEPTITLHKAMDVMHTVPKAANNMMEVGRLAGFDVNIAVHGTVLLQDTLPVAVFNINKPNIRKYKPKRVFLFEQIFIISDLCESKMRGHYYKFKSSIKLSDLRLITKVFEEPLSFIISNVRTVDVDTYIQVPTMEAKEEWTTEIQRVIDKQRDFLQVLEDPMSSMRVSPPPLRSVRACRAISDRPEMNQPQNSQQKNRKKDNHARHHKTVH